jgi:hypothetical protein
MYNSNTLPSPLTLNTSHSQYWETRTLKYKLKYIYESLYIFLNTTLKIKYQSIFNIEN